MHPGMHSLVFSVGISKIITKYVKFNFSNQFFNIKKQLILVVKNTEALF